MTRVGNFYHFGFNRCGRNSFCHQFCDTALSPQGQFKSPTPKSRWWQAKGKVWFHKKGGVRWTISPSLVKAIKVGEVVSPPDSQGGSPVPPVVDGSTEDLILVHPHLSRGSRISHFLKFWENLRVNKMVLDIVHHGYKIQFRISLT